MYLSNATNNIYFTDIKIYMLILDLNVSCCFLSFSLNFKEFWPQMAENAKMGGAASIFVIFQNPFGIFLISLIVNKKNLDLSVLEKKASIAHS